MRCPELVHVVQGSGEEGSGEEGSGEEGSGEEGSGTEGSGEEEEGDSGGEGEEEEEDKEKREVVRQQARKERGAKVDTIRMDSSGSERDSDAERFEREGGSEVGGGRGSKLGSPLPGPRRWTDPVRLAARASSFLQWVPRHAGMGADTPCHTGPWDALLRPTGAGLGTCTRIFRHSAQPRKHLPSRTPIFPVEASPYYRLARIPLIAAALGTRLSQTFAPASRAAGWYVEAASVGPPGLRALLA
eukprot:scaffold1370_cov98-Isochrysis_galbana.AAC.2